MNSEVYEFSNDPAFVGIVDVCSYQADFPNWDWDTLCKKVVSQMREGRILAWGTPEDSFRFVLQTGSLDYHLEPKKSYSQLFRSTGKVVLANYDTITMCAQFDDNALPQPEDIELNIKPGVHRITVHRFFSWNDGEQGLIKRFGDLDFIINVEEAEAFDLQEVSSIPWTWQD